MTFVEVIARARKRNNGTDRTDRIYYIRKQSRG